MGAKLRVAVAVALSATAGFKPRPYSKDKRQNRKKPGGSRSRWPTRPH